MRGSDDNTNILRSVYKSRKYYVYKENTTKDINQIGRLVLKEYFKQIDARIRDKKRLTLTD